MTSFEWDAHKAAANLVRHGISLKEAAHLLEREAGVLEMFDASHSTDEDRFVAIGASISGVLYVAFTEREDGMTRIISARRATRTEARLWVRYLAGDVG